MSDFGSFIDVVRADDLIAVVVFGSAARGELAPSSDLDVLLVVTDDAHLPEIASTLEQHEIGRLSAQVMTLRSLLSEAIRHPSFVAHIIDEGVVTRHTAQWDKAIKGLSELAFDRAALAREVDVRKKDLCPFMHAERFQNSPITALSHLYGLARSIVIIRLLQEGVREYSWRRVFDRYAELRPELATDLGRVKELRQYYEYTRDRADADVPREVPAPAEVKEAAISVRRIAS